MSDRYIPPTGDEPAWLDPFEQLANDQLAQGSSCAQVHPVVERWFRALMNGDPPAARESVAQATACLATEVLYSAPDDLLQPLLEHLSVDDAAVWVEQILLVGRAFEIALRSGELDDL